MKNVTTLIPNGPTDPTSGGPNYRCWEVINFKPCGDPIGAIRRAIHPILGNGYGLAIGGSKSSKLADGTAITGPLFTLQARTTVTQARQIVDRIRSHGALEILERHGTSPSEFRGRPDAQ